MLTTYKSILKIYKTYKQISPKVRKVVKAIDLGLSKKKKKVTCH